MSTVQLFTKDTIRYDTLLSYYYNLKDGVIAREDLQSLKFHLGYELEKARKYAAQITSKENLKSYVFDIGGIVGAIWEYFGRFVDIFEFMWAPPLIFIWLPVLGVTLAIAVLLSAVIPLLLFPIKLVCIQHKIKTEREKSEDLIHILSVNYEYVENALNNMETHTFFDKTFANFCYHDEVVKHFPEEFSAQIPRGQDFEPVGRVHMMLVVHNLARKLVDMYPIASTGYEDRSFDAAESLAEELLNNPESYNEPHSRIVNYCDSRLKSYLEMYNRWSEYKKKGEI